MYEEEILKPRPSKQGASDHCAWLPTIDGSYSAKSGYYEALNMEESAGLEPNPPPPDPFN